MADSTFGTVVGCMDGRIQLPVNEWMRRHHKVDYVDTITEAGADGVFTNGPDELVKSIENRVRISTEKHGSKIVALVAHHDCAGNPVDYKTHIDHLRSALLVLRGWVLGAEIVALWVGDDWKVTKLEM